MFSLLYHQCIFEEFLLGDKKCFLKISMNNSILYYVDNITHSLRIISYNLSEYYRQNIITGQHLCRLVN